MKGDALPRLLALVDATHSPSNPFTFRYGGEFPNPIVLSVLSRLFKSCFLPCASPANHRFTRKPFERLL